MDEEEKKLQLELQQLQRQLSQRNRQLGDLQAKYHTLEESLHLEDSVTLPAPDTQLQQQVRNLLLRTL